MSGFDLRLYVLMAIGGTSLIDVGANQNLQQRKTRKRLWWAVMWAVNLGNIAELTPLRSSAAMREKKSRKAFGIRGFEYYRDCPEILSIGRSRYLF